MKKVPTALDQLMTMQIYISSIRCHLIGHLLDLSASFYSLLFPIREPVLPGLLGSNWFDRLKAASCVEVRFFDTVNWNTTFLKVLMRLSAGYMPVNKLGSGTVIGRLC